MSRAAFAAALAALLAAAAAFPAPAAVSYAAFGDSITLGGPPFESRSGGYPRRLQTILRDEEGILATVVNYGVGGETTAQGVSRIDSVLDNGPWDVVLLMEGTNDVFKKISQATILFNLGVMDDKITARGTDVVMATIIRRLYNPSHAATNSLAAGIRTLAQQRNRYLADPWQVLCPDTACFDLYYWDGPGDPVGHPNTLGFWVLARSFSDVIAVPLPGAAAPQGPQGGIGTTQPAFTWSRVAAANWYRLAVDGPGGPVSDRWYEEAEVCGATTCSVTPPEVLADGSHSWRVRTRNPAGQGPWSADQAFVVYGQPPGASTALSPSGDHYEPAPPTPTYTWDAVPSATDYTLRLEGPSGVLLQEFHAAAAVCGASECSATPDQPLSEGEYSWRILSSNPAGPGPWSPSTRFAVYVGPPSTPTPIAPAAPRFDPRPTYRWTGAPGATGYYLEVSSESGTPVAETLDPAAICAAGECAFRPATPLAIGPHTWTVQPSNPLGPGTATGATAFEILDCAEPLDRAVPAGPIADPRTERACRHLTAGDGVVIQATGVLELHGGQSVRWETGLKVEPGGILKAGIDN